MRRMKTTHLLSVAAGEYEGLLGANNLSVRSRATGIYSTRIDARTLSTRSNWPITWRRVMELAARACNKCGSSSKSDRT